MVSMFRGWRRAVLCASRILAGRVNRRSDPGLKGGVVYKYIALVGVVRSTKFYCLLSILPFVYY